MNNNNQPFKRSLALRAAIAGIVGIGTMGMELHSAISAVAQRPEFQSRGKGGGHRARGSRMKVYAKMRKHKNQSHQGKKECERRVNQMQGRAPVSKPRRMWVMKAENLNYPFGEVYVSSRRDTLARTHFARRMGCPIVLLEGGAI